MPPVREDYRYWYGDIFDPLETEVNLHDHSGLDSGHGHLTVDRRSKSLDDEGPHLESSAVIVEGHDSPAATASLPATDDFKAPPKLTCASKLTGTTFASESNTTLANKTLNQGWLWALIRERWGLEVLSLLLSTIFIIVIVIMLYKLEGSELSKWQLSIGIDTVLSILAGLSKACLLMPTAEALGQLKWIWTKESKRKSQIQRLEGASHGNLGSLNLLIRSRGVTLASIGAAVLLLSVPLDMFYQQIIRYSMEPILDTSANATVSRSVYYNPPPQRQWRGSQWIYYENPQMAAFLSMFWTGKGIAPGIGFDCPTGNCTFEPFHTLAIDFKCAELTNFVKFGCQNSSSEWLSYEAYLGPETTRNISTCGWHIQSPRPGFKAQLMSGYEILPNGSIGEVLATRLFPLSDVWSNDLYFGNDSYSLPIVKHPIANFILASTPGSFEGARKNATPAVTECEVHWVVKKIRSMVISGRLYEDELETLEFSDALNSSWDPTNADVYLPNFRMQLPDPFAANGTDSTYGMNNVTARRIWQSWAAIVPSTYTFPNASAPYGPGLKLSWLSGGAHIQEALQPALPWDTPSNVTDHMAQMVLVMNQVVRGKTSQESKAGDYVTGKAFQYVAIVRVTWQWITFPVSIWFIALVFIAATMIRSSNRRHVPESGRSSRSWAL